MVKIFHKLFVIFSTFYICGFSRALECHETCLTCTGEEAYQCESCGKGIYLYKRTVGFFDTYCNECLRDDHCTGVKRCKKTFSCESDSDVCHRKVTNCSECDANFVCSACADGFELANGNCHGDASKVFIGLSFVIVPITLIMCIGFCHLRNQSKARAIRRRGQQRTKRTLVTTRTPSGHILDEKVIDASPERAARKELQRHFAQRQEMPPAVTGRNQIQNPPPLHPPHVPLATATVVDSTTVPSAPSAVVVGVTNNQPPPLNPEFHKQ